MRDESSIRLRRYKVRVRRLILSPTARADDAWVRITAPNPDQACYMALSRAHWLAWIAGGLAPKHSLPMRVLGIERIK